MDPVTQGALGAALPQSVARAAEVRAFAALGFASGLAPDLDVLIRSETDPLLWLEYHRAFTHALIFVPVGAALCALVGYGVLRGRLSAGRTYLACLLGFATHGLLDACTSYGTQLFWPFSNLRVAWNTVSVIDPLFTGPLLVAVVTGTLTRDRRWAAAGLVWAAAYIALGVIQQNRALDSARELAALRGHDVARLTAKPGFANLLLWKVVYEHDGRYRVDGLRLGMRPTWCGGGGIRKLDPLRDLPWLAAESTQRRDLERFRWFSNDYLALDPELPDYVIDVRYSSLPNTIDGLWGVVLDRAAPPGVHAGFKAVRSRRTEGMERLAAMLSGGACRELDRAIAGAVVQRVGGSGIGSVSDPEPVLRH